MVPAPTTAALNTNMSRNSSFCFRSEVGGRPRLALEARKGALERVAHRAAHEGEVDYSRNSAILLDGVLQLEGHGCSLGTGLKADRLAAVDLRVLDLDRLAYTGLEAHDALEHAPATPGLRVPDDHRAGFARPALVDPLDVAEPVDERRPAPGVVPQLLGVAGGDTGELQLGLHPPHRAERYLCRDGLGLRDAARQERLAGDDQALDLARALVQLNDLRFAHHLLDGLLLDEAVAAVDLHGVRGDLHRGVRGEALG